MATETLPPIDALSLLNDKKHGKAFYGLARTRYPSTPVLECWRGGSYNGISNFGRDTTQLRINLDPGTIDVKQEAGLIALTESLGITAQINKRSLTFDTNGDVAKNERVKQFSDAFRDANEFLQGPMIYRQRDNSFPVFLGFRGNDSDAVLKESLKADVERVQRQFSTFGITMQAGAPYCKHKGTHKPTEGDSPNFYDTKDAVFTAADRGNEEKLRRFLGRIDELEASITGRAPTP